MTPPAPRYEVSGALRRRVMRGGPGRAEGARAPDAPAPRRRRRAAPLALARDRVALVLAIAAVGPAGSRPAAAARA